MEMGHTYTKEEKNDGETIVSMRCRRHKKRFNVPTSWLDECDWLCPKCYSRLTEEERDKYKPPQSHAPDIRKAESGKDVVWPTSKECQGQVAVSDCEEDASAEEIKAEEPVAEPAVCQEQEKQKRPYRKHERKSSLSDNPLLAGLLPRYKIKCMKCGETAPCHYSWFSRSTVLCPACYGKMKPSQIEDFHSRYNAEKPDKKKAVPLPTVKIKEFTPSTIKIKDAKWTRDSNSLNSGGFWTCSHIMSATKRELEEAVEQGKVSKARYRIEMRRRNNFAYYDLFPVKPGMSSNILEYI